MENHQNDYLSERDTTPAIAANSYAQPSVPEFGGREWKNNRDGYAVGSVFDLVAGFNQSKRGLAIIEAAKVILFGGIGLVAIIAAYFAAT